jgi:hypothetical protein
MKKGEKKYYFYFLICLLADIALILFLVLPLKEKIEANSRVISYQKAILATQDLQLAKIREFREEENVFQKIEKEILSGFVDPDSPIDFLNYLEETAKGLDLSITIFRLEKKPKDSESFNLGFKLEGSFENIIKFIKLIENSNFFLEVSNLNFEKKESTTTATVILKVLSKQ